MYRGKGRSKPTLGEAASDFMEQWKASRSEVAQSASAKRGEATRRDGKQAYEQTLPSWKRGGGEVKVTRGTSTGFERRKKKPIAPPPGKHPAPLVSEVWIVKPAPPRIPKLEPVRVVKSLRQRLREASADVCELRISAAMSRPRSFVGLAPVVEDQPGRLAILGLDFGTAFTKAVVRWSGRHYAVDWSRAVEGEDQHLLASVFSEASDGLCVLGAHEEGGWRVCDRIKLRLLTSDGTNIEEQLADAVIFVALTFRYVVGWLRGVIGDADQGLRWRLHLGLPTKSWDSGTTTERFKTVAQAARVLACMSGPVTRTAALEALRMTDQVDRPAVDVFPEFACQLYSYLQSPERREDLHALVDIGAGTLDVAYFNVFMKDGEALLPIFASEVDRLGAHYLIAALAGTAGRAAWTDSESSLSDDDAGCKLDCPPSDVCNRRSLYLNSVAEVFNLVTRTARKIYPTSPAFNQTENVRLFLCGGGSRIPSLQRRFKRIAKEAASLLGMSFLVSELVKPRDVAGEIESGFDRLSVAYGLSQLAGNLGSVMRSAMLESIAPRERFVEKHRDDDR